jgi:hypothetical protein
MKKQITNISLFFALLGVSPSAYSYEIPNHADMSEQAIRYSTLNRLTNNRFAKLEALGLRSKALDDNLQRFPLTAELAPIPMCYGIKLNQDGQVVADTDFGMQPTWGEDTGGGALLTIANLFRYGACFEDSIEPDPRSLAHFYNPQNGGSGIVQGNVQLGPNSPDWMLMRNPPAGTILGNAQVGANHFTWMDARNNFYYALTQRNIDETNPVTNVRREVAWGKTFQALGHVVHHLQDMGQPQHTRNDAHCDDVPQCRDGWKGMLGGYRPSGYEKYLLDQFQLVRNLASLATAPIIFGLPREFWSMDGDSITTHASPQRGIAAYSSTNFVSDQTDFVMQNYRTPLSRIELPYPQPSALPNEVRVDDLFANADAPTLDNIRTTVCGGNFSTCTMKFYGSAVDPMAKKSAVSAFSQELLGAPNVTRKGLGFFKQNFWTYADAASKLVPTAVEYSTGLINYFFRGELDIKLPEEGVYGILDHAVEKNKNADGFRLIKAKVKNATADILLAQPRAGGTSTIAQHMREGSFIAVAKFHRNSCYTTDLSGQIGQPGIDWQSCRTPTEEILVSAPATEWSGGSATSGAAITTTALDAGVEKTLSFDFSANPIPIEATDLFIQVVFKGKLGEEVDAVAVGTKDISEPTFYSYANFTDACHGQLTSRSHPNYTSDVNYAREGICSTGEPVLRSDMTGALKTLPTIPAGAQRSGTGPLYNVWARTGFNEDLPHTKVVEWTGSSVTEIGGGEYMRIGFLRDAVEKNLDVSLNLRADTTGGLRIPGDFVMPSGPSIAIISGENVCGGNVSLLSDVSYLGEGYVLHARPARVQLNESEAAPTMDEPKYLVMRGVTMGLNTAEWRARENGTPNYENDGLFSAITYWGERALSGINFLNWDIASYRDMPQRQSALLQVPALSAGSLSPKRLQRIYFSSAPAFEDPVRINQQMFCDDAHPDLDLAYYNRPSFLYDVNFSTRRGRIVGKTVIEAYY